MTNKYQVNFKGRTIALGYSSPHPAFENQMLVSIIPIERSGKWVDDTLELRLTRPYHDIFPQTKEIIEALQEVLAQAKIEPWKCDVIKCDD